MSKVYVETEDMSKEQLTELLIDKDRKIEKLEHFKQLVINIYKKNKVSDTRRINKEKEKSFIKMMEDVMVIYDQ